jgi:hypothetical protein
MEVGKEERLIYYISDSRETTRENGKNRAEIPKAYVDDRRPISALETWFLTGPGI